MSHSIAVLLSLYVFINHSDSSCFVLFVCTAPVLCIADKYNVCSQTWDLDFSISATMCFCFCFTQKSLFPFDISHLQILQMSFSACRCCCFFKRKRKKNTQRHKWWSTTGHKYSEWPAQLIVISEIDEGLPRIKPGRLWKELNEMLLWTNQLIVVWNVQEPCVFDGSPILFPLPTKGSFCWILFCFGFCRGFCFPPQDAAHLQFVYFLCFGFFCVCL